jgi:hypothetical protein
MDAIRQIWHRWLFAPRLRQESRSEPQRLAAPNLNEVEWARYKFHVLPVPPPLSLLISVSSMRSNLASLLGSVLCLPDDQTNRCRATTPILTLAEMSSITSRQQSLCSSCRRNLFSRSPWRHLWQLADVAGEPFTFTVTHTMLLESVANRSCLYIHILDNAPAAEIDKEVRTIVEYTMPSDVRPAKFNQLVLTIEPPSSFAGKIFYFGISAKHGETLYCRCLLRLSHRDPCVYPSPRIQGRYPQFRLLVCYLLDSRVQVPAHRVRLSH